MEVWLVLDGIGVHEIWNVDEQGAKKRNPQQRKRHISAVVARLERKEMGRLLG